ncbi:hypothetical protein AYI68_g4889 [Smittium mucronatum]|uniref:Uncharacterized protein n=1 Tax=Smittium mucronatum TaxID=133383 RepID=A0A1R0GVV4_9FUNG|nr:hypothetical protein AYI68_g4889 [Smittium mucronatum]
MFYISDRKFIICVTDILLEMFLDMRQYKYVYFSELYSDLTLKRRSFIKETPMILQATKSQLFFFENRDFLPLGYGITVFAWKIICCAMKKGIGFG